MLLCQRAVTKWVKADETPKNQACIAIVFVLPLASVMRRETAIRYLCNTYREKCNTYRENSGELRQGALLKQSGYLNATCYNKALHFASKETGAFDIYIGKLTNNHFNRFFLQQSVEKASTSLIWMGLFLHHSQQSSVSSNLGLVKSQLFWPQVSPSLHSESESQSPSPKSHWKDTPWTWKNVTIFISRIPLDPARFYLCSNRFCQCRYSFLWRHNNHPSHQTRNCSSRSCSWRTRGLLPLTLAMSVLIMVVNVYMSIYTLTTDIRVTISKTFCALIVTVTTITDHRTIILTTIIIAVKSWITEIAIVFPANKGSLAIFVKVAISLSKTTLISIKFKITTCIISKAGHCCCFSCCSCCGCCCCCCLSCCYCCCFPCSCCDCCCCCCSYDSRKQCCYQCFVSSTAQEVTSPLHLKQLLVIANLQELFLSEWQKEAFLVFFCEIDCIAAGFFPSVAHCYALDLGGDLNSKLCTVEQILVELSVNVLSFSSMML